MTPDGAAQADISVLQGPPFFLCQVRIFQGGKNVIELCFHLLKFCAEHDGLRFLPLPLQMLMPGEPAKAIIPTRNWLLITQRTVP